MLENVEPGVNLRPPARLGDLRQRRSLFFDLRGLLGIVVIAILLSRHTLVSPGLWLLGILFLASDLVIGFLPPSWFRNPGLSYAVFFLDMGVLTLVLYSLSNGDAESLLLYYLTVFIATMGEDVRRSVGIAVVVGALYIGLRLDHDGNVLADPGTLLRIPLFFVTAISCGYLAQQVRAQKSQVRTLTAIQKGLREDLTESEQLRIAAEAAEERFRNLVQDVDAIVWEMDPRTFQFTFVSQQAEQILGYPVERWLTELHFWANHIVPEDRDRVLAISRKATAEGKDFDIEYRTVAADGRVVWLRDLMRVIRDAYGRIAQLRGVMVDITELKRTEDTLDRLRRQNELLLNSAGEGIYGVDPQGKTTFINPAAARMLGWEAKELIGKVQHDISHHTRPDGSPYPVERCPIYAAFKDGAVHRVAEEVFWRKDGTNFPVEYVSTPLKERGEIVGAVVVFKDISERKRAEEALSRLAATVESSNDAIAGGTLDGTIGTWNRAAEKIYGYLAEEVTGRPFSILLSPERPGEFTQIIERIKRGENVQDYETVHMRKDSRPISVALTVSLVSDAAGKTIGLSVIARDITERTKLEEQLRQAQKMEAVGRLAGGVAHDFNNLLTIISGYSQMLLSRFAPGDTVREQVQEIKKAGERAGALTRQLLTFSRRQVLAPQVLDLNAVVTNVGKMVGRLIGEDIELVTSPGAGLGRVKADPSQIEQVIMNLAVNARDAMPEGGKLILETANVEVDEAFARNHIPMGLGPYVVLSVKDTGCGMDAEVQAHLFEPFFTTKEVGKGTGLGLATVYGIVKQSGGYIWADSEPGKGTTFKIYFPRIEELASVVEVAKAQAGLPSGSETILLVEDEEPVRSLVRGILMASGYAVLEAGRPEEALLICQRHQGPIHLLLTDVVMPEMGGRELAKHVEIVRPDTKVLYMSGYTNGSIVHAVSDARAVLLQKPFTPESLARKVREVLDTSG
jgi:two-component system, cell cycle sensor histidine kinase and response regulator CckA